MRRQATARPEPERVARGQHRHRLAAQGQHWRYVKGQGPLMATAAYTGQSQMPRAAEDVLCLGQGRAATIAQTMQTIFTDSND